MRTPIVLLVAGLCLAGCGPRRPVVYLGERPTMAQGAEADRNIDRWGLLDPATEDTRS